jgi:predicted transcriptional regulator YheO
MPKSVKSAHKSLKLSVADKAILASYQSLLDGFAQYFGGGYEFVLHSLEDLDHSVIKIVNGHHTGRTVGAPVTDLALTMLTKLQETGGVKMHVSYGGKTKRGEPLHSSTMAILGEKNRIIGLLCINFHLNTPLHQVFTDLFRTHGQIQEVPENFAANVEESISDAVAAARRQVDGCEIAIAALRNKRIIGLLLEQGIFQLKGAAPTVASMLGLSRGTVYLHLRDLRGQ